MEKNNAFLISESTITSKPEIVGYNEATNSVTFKAVLQDADTPNRNRRSYQYKGLKNALNSDYIQERLERKAWYGECGHPLSNDVKRQLHIDQTRISHIIREVWFEGNVVKGLIETANTRSGRDMMGLIRQGSEVAFSMRGLGSKTEQQGNILYVKDPIKIFTYDWVIHPSHEIAYMEKFLSESTMDSLLPNKNADLKLLSEGSIIPLTENEDMTDFICDEDNDMEDIIKKFDLAMNESHITLNEDARFLDVKEGSKKFKVRIEDYAKKQLDTDLIEIFK